MLSARARVAPSTWLLLAPVLLLPIVAACAKGATLPQTGPGGAPGGAAGSSATSASAESSTGTGGATSASSSTGGSTGCTIGGMTYFAGTPDPTNECQICDPTVSTKAWSPGNEGALCAAEMVCSAGTCAASCYVGGKVQAPGASDPSTPCEVCDPTTSTSTDVPAPDGTACGQGKVCKSGGCIAGCFIGNAFVSMGAPDPTDPCKSCQPPVDVGDYSPDADGTQCAPGQICAADACTPSCFIGGNVVAPGAVNPLGACQACVPATSTQMYTPIADGTSCGTGDYCSAGSCVQACFIGGMVKMPKSVDPSNPCQSCQPAASTTAWTSVADGSPCGNGLICGGGACQGECYIGGQLIASGTINPADPCQRCAPGTSTVAWSSVADGTSCASGNFCSAGACVASCLVNGMVVPAGGVNPLNACQTCQPAVSTTAFSPASDGLVCGAGEVCSGGACGAGCYIGGKFYLPSGQNPANGCQICQPASSTSAWSLASNGAGCGPGGLICDNGLCSAGCYIGTTFYAAGTPDPTSVCMACQPAVLTTGFSMLPNFASCGGGKICASGTCKLGCAIGGTYYAPNAVNPGDPCLSCQPSTSTSAWSNAGDGTACTMGGNVCIAGACQPGCLIGGSVYAAGALEPGHPCQGCVPTQSTTTWTTLSDGSNCGSGEVCVTGACQAGCYISGNFYAPGPNPAGAGGNGDPACETCAPAQSTTAWSPYNQGSACGNPYSSGATCSGTKCCGATGTACSGSAGCCSFTCSSTCQ